MNSHHPLFLLTVIEKILQTKQNDWWGKLQNEFEAMITQPFLSETTTKKDIWLKMNDKINIMKDPVKKIVSLSSYFTTNYTANESIASGSINGLTTDK